MPKRYRDHLNEIQNSTAAAILSANWLADKVRPRALSECPLEYSSMPRGKRICPAGMVFHSLNRSVARRTLLEKEADDEAFERVVEEAHDRVPWR